MWSELLTETEQRRERMNRDDDYEFSRIDEKGQSTDSRGTKNPKQNTKKYTVSYIRVSLQKTKDPPLPPKK